jgi:CubicO group peptidase (beta-lactamase class C family)
MEIMKRLAMLASLACITTTAAACSDTSAPSDTGAVTNPLSLDFSAFDSAMGANLDANGLPGATVVVVQKDSGIVYARGYGAYDKNRLFLLASASKVLSVGAIMRLADAGRLDIDAPISTYVGSAWGNAKGALTLAQMMSNSSGMVGLVDQPLYLPYICQYRPVGTLLECGESIYDANDSAQVVPPDTKFRYGGGQWQLAGAVASVASGTSWPQLIRDTYVNACGASSLGYTNPFAGGGTQGYPSWFTGDASAIPATENPNIEGGGYITVEDYGKILLMHLRGGMCGNTRVLSEAAVTRMQQDRIGEVYGGVTDNAVLQGYGMGWWIDRAHPGVFADIGFYGATPWLDTRRGYGAMILIEGTGPQGAALWVATKPILDSIIDTHF